MILNINIPAKAVDALVQIAYELKELRLSLCPPLQPRPHGPKKEGFNVRYVNNDDMWKDYREQELLHQRQSEPNIDQTDR